MTTIAPTEFNKPTDITNYWKALIDSGFDYHLDDDPKLIFCFGVSEQQQEIIINNHKSLWDYAEHNQIEPWDHIDIFAVPEMKNMVFDQFKEWLKIRNPCSLRRVSIRLWIEQNYSSAKDNESLIDYVWNKYNQML